MTEWGAHSKSEDARRPGAASRGDFTRRASIRLLLGGAIMATAAMSRPAEEQETLSIAQATQFIRHSGDRLIAILDGSAEPPAKRAQLEALIADTLDVGGIARFALGRFWHGASDGQRSEYIRLFPAVLLGDVDKAFGTYRGVRFSIDRATQTEDNTVQVSTTVFRPDYPVQVTWIVGSIGGATKVIDIVAGGFSMRISQRDDCTSLLKHDNSIETLIETLRRQAAAVS